MSDQDDLNEVPEEVKEESIVIGEGLGHMSDLNFQGPTEEVKEGEENKESD